MPVVSAARPPVNVAAGGEGRANALRVIRKDVVARARLPLDELSDLPFRCKHSGQLLLTLHRQPVQGLPCARSVALRTQPVGAINFMRVTFRTAIETDGLTFAC